MAQIRSLLSPSPSAEQIALPTSPSSLSPPPSVGGHERRRKETPPSQLREHGDHGDQSYRLIAPEADSVVGTEESWKVEGANMLSDHSSKYHLPQFRLRKNVDEKSPSIPRTVFLSKDPLKDEAEFNEPIED